MKGDFKHEYLVTIIILFFCVLDEEVTYYPIVEENEKVSVNDKLEFKPFKSLIAIQEIVKIAKDSKEVVYTLFFIFNIFPNFYIINEVLFIIISLFPLKMFCLPIF